MKEIEKEIQEREMQEREKISTQKGEEQIAPSVNGASGLEEQGVDSPMTMTVPLSTATGGDAKMEEG